MLMLLWMLLLMLFLARPAVCHAAAAV